MIKGIVWQLFFFRFFDRISSSKRGCPAILFLFKSILFFKLYLPPPFCTATVDLHLLVPGLID